MPSLRVLVITNADHLNLCKTGLTFEIRRAMFASCTCLGLCNRPQDVGKHGTRIARFIYTFLQIGKKAMLAPATWVILAFLKVRIERMIKYVIFAFR